LRARLAQPGSGSTWRIGLELADDFPAGRHEEALTILTDDPDYAELRVRVTVVKRTPRDVSVHPAEVRFVAAAQGAIPSRIVLVRGDDERAVVIDDVVVDHPAISVHGGLEAGRIFRFNPDDFDVGAKILDVGGDPSRQTTTAHRDKHGMQRPGVLAQDFHADGTLAGDHVGIIIGMHKYVAMLFHQHAGVHRRLVEGITVQHHLATQIAYGADLDLGGSLRHDDDRLDAQPGR